MLSKTIKNKTFVLKLKNQELTRVAAKYLFINSLNHLNYEIQFKNKIRYKIVKDLDKNNYKTKIVRRCLFSGRSRSSLRLVGVSRLKLKEMLKQGYLPGFKKAVW